MKRAIHWFRRDLRLADNPALSAAAHRAEEVIPLYVVSEWEGTHGWTGAHRQEFLAESLSTLAEDLRKIGGRLIIRQGDPVEEIQRLMAETGAEAIYYQCDPDPYGRAVEEKLKRTLRGEISAFSGAWLFGPDEILTAAGTPYRVFTPYGNAWMKKEAETFHPAIRKLRTPRVASLALPTLQTWKLTKEGGVLPGGESAARRRMKNFVTKRLAHYAEDRDGLGGEATSRLSQDMRFGLFSIRELVERCRRQIEKLPPTGRASGNKFLRELAWRDFYFGILWHHPNVLKEDFSPRFRHLRWPGKSADFRRWREAETGFPVVDAAMRELRATGFMANRARMIVAMFLTKDLHVHWREGERWFMQQLTDGEIASNNGGWQWCAGTGADAAPYFRIQNPWSQSARFDSAGIYIKHWLPELRDVPAAKLSQPPPHGERLVQGYPAPMVDHAREREKTLDLFAAAKRAADSVDRPS